VYLVRALDQVGNTATSPFTVIQDATAPTETMLVNDQAGLSFEVFWTDYDTGSGISGYDEQYIDSSQCWIT